MGREKFHTICHTCETDHRTAAFDEANETFHQHAEQGHDVETQNLVSLIQEHIASADSPQCW